MVAGLIAGAEDLVHLQLADGTEDGLQIDQLLLREQVQKPAECSRRRRV